jgi:hypothetical protein
MCDFSICFAGTTQQNAITYWTNTPYFIPANSGGKKEYFS